VLFFLLAKPFGVSGPAAGEVGQDFMWLGKANDWVIVVQFLTSFRSRWPCARGCRPPDGCG
jgi:hypothetical protein